MTRVKKIFHLLERLNDYYKMLTGQGLKEKVKTEETINAFLVRKDNKVRV